MKLNYSKGAKKWMDEHGISESYCSQVVESAEKSGIKAVTADKKLNLAKKVIENITVYVQYKVSNKEKVDVEDVYSHRVQLLERGLLE